MIILKLSSWRELSFYKELMGEISDSGDVQRQNTNKTHNIENRKEGCDDEKENNESETGGTITTNHQQQQQFGIGTADCQCQMWLYTAIGRSHTTEEKESHVMVNPNNTNNPNQQSRRTSPFRKNKQ